jgi:hypothetical protein
MAENKLQKATKEIEEWTRRCDFKIPNEKTKTMLIHQSVNPTQNRNLD